MCEPKPVFRFDSEVWLEGPSPRMIDEFLARAYYEEKGLHTVVARLFDTIGLRQTGQYGMVVPRLVRLGLAGEPIPVYGDGTQRWSSTWMGDGVDAMLALIAHLQALGEVFNIGHTKEISIYELAALVKQMTGSASEILLAPYEQAYEVGFEDMVQRALDISKIQRLIGYRPVLNLPEMLERVIAHERDRT